MWERLVLSRGGHHYKCGGGNHHFTGATGSPWAKFRRSLLCSSCTRRETTWKQSHQPIATITHICHLCLGSKSHQSLFFQCSDADKIGPWCYSIILVPGWKHRSILFCIEPWSGDPLKCFSLGIPVLPPSVYHHNKGWLTWDLKADLPVTFS